MDHWREYFPSDALGKFCNRDSLLKILAGRRLLWSRPSRFNDPFDCQPHFEFLNNVEAVSAAAIQEFDRFLKDEVISVSITNGMGKATCLLADAVKSGQLLLADVRNLLIEEVAEMSDTSKDFLKKYRSEVVQNLNDAKVLCLSKAFDEILMWSHYADNHSGALVVFSSVSPDSQFSIAKPVKYCDELPELLDARSHALLITGQISMTDRLRISDAFDQITLTKASSWKYEKEWRISGGAGFSPDAEFELNPFSLDDVVAVVFGAKFPSDEGDAIKKVASTFYPHAKWFRSKLSSTKFCLDLELICN